MRPSFITSSLSALIFIYAFIYFLNVKDKIKDEHNIVIIILLFSIAIGMHSVHHYKEEIYYNYNPLKTFTIFPDDDTISRSSV